MLCLPDTILPENKLNEFKYAVTKVIVTEHERLEFASFAQKVIQRARTEEETATLDSFPEHVSQLFGNLALNPIGDEARYEAAKSMLQRKGLYDLLSKDGDVLTAVVRISLLPPAAGSELIATELADLDIDLTCLLKNVAAVEQRFGLPLIEKLDTGRLLCRV